MCSIPVVIFHINGRQDYFVNCVNLSSTKNKVYLIGDDSNKDAFVNNQNVTFFHIDDLHSKKAEEFKHAFVNYSTNVGTYELLCFLRVFYLNKLLKKTGDQWVFHTDSDCIVLDNITKLFPENKRCVSYSIQKVDNPHHMVGSIHNALLNSKFCDKFIELCLDIYKTRTKFHLIEPKIQWHNQVGMGGGICDMTLYYLLWSEKIIDVTDLNELIEYGDNDGESAMFDHNINDPYGFKGEDTYHLVNGIKRVVMKDGNYYFADKDGMLRRTLTLHFQGRAKSILSGFSFE